MGVFKALLPLSSLCERFSDNIEVKTLKSLLAKQKWTFDDRQLILNTLSLLLLRKQFTITISEHFSPILLDLLMRAKHNVEYRLDLFIALSKLISNYFDANNFAFECFQSSLFSSSMFSSNYNNINIAYDLILAVYNYLSLNRLWFQSSFDISFIVDYIEHFSEDIKWIAIQCYIILFDLDHYHANALIASKFTDIQVMKFKLKYYHIFTATTKWFNLDNALLLYEDFDNEDVDDRQSFSDLDFSDKIVSVCGILLNKVEAENINFKDHDLNIVSVPSFKTNLRSLSLGVALCKPVLIEGPVGSGKTVLIEYLASLTQRHCAPHIIKVQMGDQIDSKILIGTYCCTDIPGEFVWKAGPLFEAMKDGHWIILEDIDCAPLDVISMLSTVLETNSLLSLPGCGTKLRKVHNGFRIFFTRRLVSAHFNEVKYSEFSIKSFNYSNSIDKLCHVLTLVLYSREELIKIIETKWPNLSLIANRVLDVYYELLNHNSEDGNFVSKRNVCLRDLLKWCHRISKYFILNSEESANNALLDASDCFLQYASNLSLRNSQTTIIGAFLNITKSKCNYLCCVRKPEFKLTDKFINIGRISVERNVQSLQLISAKPDSSSFAFTQQCLLLMEKICVAIANNEAILLCGETGTGKTSCVQYLASHLGKPLRVINMNQQSDCCDLLGGYKPTEIRFMFEPLKNEFLKLFALTFECEKNAKFLTHISMTFNSQDWTTLFTLISHVCSAAQFKDLNVEHLKQWKEIEDRIYHLKSTLKLNQKGCLAFSFIEGSLIKAMKNGEWILLDEINLAESETLQCLSAILDSEHSSIMLLDKADNCLVRRHPNFRLFACMNPATDIGKRELPLGIRLRFTEFFVDELDNKSDLRILVSTYLDKLDISSSIIERIVDFYLSVKDMAKRNLKDATGSRPTYSLRTLCRALTVAASNPCRNVHKSLYESFCLSFLTQLDESSRVLVETNIIETLFESGYSLKSLKKCLEMPISDQDFVCFEGFWISKGSKDPIVDESYIFTPTVKKHLKDVCRVISIGKSYPILLQGETSVGKTSLILWLAKATGNACVRVNNHEHTDLQEYVGSYCVDANGKLFFKEGILVEAMKRGHWIILDELNLAPTEVLEALNRVLDDNRELFITETQQTIKAHQKFMLFATQNPAGLYGGRKILSRAFRNRFVELHFNEIPCNELEIILHQRCSLPLSYAKRMVGVLLDLRVRRRDSGVFAGKHGYITLRDLFRWGERYRLYAKHQKSDQKFYDWDMHLAKDGYILLAGRVRKIEEEAVIQSVLESRFKTKLDRSILFSEHSFLNQHSSEMLSEFQHIVWTKNLSRIGTLLSQAIIHKEPVLLVGDTGCGKTTICQFFAAIKDIQLFTINCHMNTESSDFLGSLRPYRSHNNEFDESQNTRLFEWIDGPLVNAMREGAYFLVDEISLADDSVLERLNSVLEPERTLLLAENNSMDDINDSLPVITAKESFRYMATMNPGGDFGKKELSLALRNRFTEIWCHSWNDIKDIKNIICHNLNNRWIEIKSEISDAMCEFLVWFNVTVYKSQNIVSSVRDVLSWCQFVNVSTDSKRVKPLSLRDSYIHGALLVFVDSLGFSGFLANFDDKNLNTIREECMKNLRQFSEIISDFEIVESEKHTEIMKRNFFIMEPFYISNGPLTDRDTDSFYSWSSPNVSCNVLRILRAMQLPKPILLEGAPGVGKTSLIQAIAKASGHKVIRINLSEQTDVSDLFGSDLPVEDGQSLAKFAFRDGPLLQALKSDSTWIILDELNLASQSVLEGLNACLDHRSELFIPELNKTFKISKSETRIFGCQNPYHHGGARKGLPRSFLNRFTNVYIEKFNKQDYITILSSMFKMISESIINKMVEFNEEVINEIVKYKKFAQIGSPWQFNLRELIRWCELITHCERDFNDLNPHNYVKLIYISKMRTFEDRIKMIDCCDKFFANSTKELIKMKITQSHLQIGYSILERTRLISSERNYLNILNSQKEALESLMKCIEMNWMAILVGASGVGKTAVIQILADLTGRELRVFSVNPEIDAMDLLGGFEQKDLMNHLQKIEDRLLKFCFTLFKLIPNSKAKIIYILKCWFEIYKINLPNDSTIRLMEKLNLLSEIVDNLFDIFVEHREEIIIFRQNIDNLKCLMTSDKQNGSFEWRDSLLIDALRDGSWLLIENANLCSASVLDRLNGLLEPNGELIISERGSIDGKIEVIKPHPQFRLILSMDPINGELSSAMRNRGIEINLFPITYKNDIILQLKSLGVNNDNIWKLFLSYLVNKHNKSIERLDFSCFIKAVPYFAFEYQHGFKNKFLLIESEEKNSFNEEFNNLYFMNNIKDLLDFDNKELENSIYLQNFKLDSLTSCVIQDKLILDALKHEPLMLCYFKNEFSKSMALKIFMEDSSVNDYTMRLSIIKEEPSYKNFILNYDLFPQISSQIIELFSRDKHNSKSITNFKLDYQIDIRSDVNAYKFCWNHNNSIEKHLNRWHLNLFWSQLKFEQLNICEASDSKFSFNKTAQLLINNKISGSLFQSTIVTIYNAMHEIEEKIVKYSLDLNPTNEEYLKLQEMILWIHQLINSCQEIKLKNHLLNSHSLNNFQVIWVLANDKSITKLQSLLNIDISKNINYVNDCLQIETFEFDKEKQRLLSNLCNSNFVFYSEETSTLFISFARLCNRLNDNNYKLDLNLMISIGKYIYQLMCNDYKMIELNQTLKDAEDIIHKQSFNNFDETNFADVITKREKLSNALFEPLFQSLFYFCELSLLTKSSVNETNDILNFINNMKFSKIYVNPLHIASIYKLVETKKITTDLILHHWTDFLHSFNIINLMKCWKYNYNENNENRGLNLLTAEQTPIISLTCCYIFEHKENGLLSEKKDQMNVLKKLLISRCESTNCLETQNMLRLHFDSIKCWFTKLLESFEVHSPHSSLKFQNNFVNNLCESAKLIINDLKDEFNSSIASVFIGLATAHLTAPTFPIDPIERSNCKINYYAMHLKLINCELDIRNALSIIKFDRTIIETCEHPLIIALINKKNYLENKIKKLQSNISFRVDSSQYYKLKAEVKQFLETIIDQNSLTDFIKKLQNFHKSNYNESSLLRFIDESSTLQKTIYAFIERMQTEYCLYSDLLNVFLIGISFILYGLKSSTYFLQRDRFITKDMQLNSYYELKSILNIIGHFCNNKTPSFIAEYLSSDKTLCIISKLLKLSQTDDKLNISRVFKSALLEIYNEIALNNKSNSLILMMCSIFNIFANNWQKSIEKINLKQQQDDALYIYRPKTDDTDVSEDELNKIMVEKHFPTYYQSFNDIIDEYKSEDSLIQDETIGHTNIEVFIENDNMADLIKVHKHIIESIIENNKFFPNFEKSYKIRYYTLLDIMKTCGILLDASIDADLIDGHIIACDSYLKENNSNCLENSFNIYQNSCYYESNLCLTILHQLEDKLVNHLLPQFENHPILIKLLKIIHRIFDFDFKTPLIKFVTGLEVLLQSAQDWQLIAHKDISLADNLNDITQLIIKWRKLELKHWSQCLDSVKTTIEEKQLELWFFHFYTSITALMNDTSNNKAEDIKQFISHTKKFMENCTLGEFNVRLNLLSTFMIHVKCFDVYFMNRDIFIPLQNLLNFYNQFKSSIEKAIENEKNPIEKEVKNFVEITKWKDTNFWSVKNSIEKSHKQLFGYMKKYELSLSKLAKNNFSIETENDVSNWQINLTVKPLFKQQFTSYSSNLFENFRILNQSFSLYKKSTNYGKKLVNKCSYIQDTICSVDRLSIDIIQGIQELSALNVSINIKDKIRWKKIVNQIQNRKRSALNDLFKTLSNIGLSYRKGLIMFDKISLDDIIITVPCIEEYSILNNLFDFQVKSDLQSSNDYFYKSIARYASLHLTLELPNKQLTSGNISRIKGIAAHLMQIIINNRQEVAENFLYYNNIQSIHNNLLDFSTADELNAIIPNKIFNRYRLLAKNYIIKINAFLHRVKEFISSLNVEKEESQSLSYSKNEFLFSQEIINKYNQYLASQIEMLYELTKKLNNENYIYCAQNFIFLKESFVNIFAFIDDLNIFFKTESIFSLNLFSEQLNSINEEAIDLKANFDELLTQYTSITDSSLLIEVNNKSVINCVKSPTNIIKSILTTFENIYKHFENINCDENDEGMKNCIAFNDVFIALKYFQVKNFYSLLSDLINKFSDDVDLNKSILKLRSLILSKITPLIHNYLKCLEYFLTLCVASLRTSNKLLSILLGLFSQLCSNGFCLPPELNDELENNTDMTLRDIQDGGFGEGEGIKDVSDKIESEDQLEDALNGEKSKTDENDIDSNIDEEENGIEMSDDFDGKCFSPSNKQNTDSENSSEETDEDLDDTMGDVDDESNIFDEKFWGSDEDDKSDDSNLDDTDIGGKDTYESKLVAKDDNQSLQNSKTDSNLKEDNDENSLNECVNEYPNDEVLPEDFNPLKQKENIDEIDKNEVIPEDIKLDNENDDEDEKDEHMSVSEDNNDCNQEDNNMDNTDDNSVDNKEDNNVNNTEDQMEDKAEDAKDNEDSNLDESHAIEKSELNNNDNNIDVDENDKKDKSNLGDSAQLDLDEKHENPLLSNEHLRSNCDKDTNESKNTYNNSINDSHVEDMEEHGFGEAQHGGDNASGSIGKMQTSINVEQYEEKSFRQLSNDNKPRRSRADNNEKVAKRQRILDNPEEDENDQNLDRKSNDKMIDSNLYRHIHSDTQEADNEVIDIANDDEEELNPMPNLEHIDSNFDNPQELKPEENIPKTSTIKSQKMKESQRTSKSENEFNSNNQQIESDRMELENIVLTSSVKRGPESTFHYSQDIFKSKNLNDFSKFHKHLEELNPIQAINIDNEILNAWKECETRVSPLVYELCEQLQLVLEPTKKAKLKGDYRSGKRLNMRKVIAYIASDFRKDKIWLRRTKPSKRQYQIIIAVDDSLSMADNQSKQLAFESLALLGKSLSLIEAGELAIMSFGENVQLLHTFNEPFSNDSGANMISQFTFRQNQTKVAQLLDSVFEIMLKNQRNISSMNREISQLLIIVSDGRGIFSEGEDVVRHSIRKVQDLGVFIVFIIIDNPLNKDSILDIRVPTFDSQGKVKIESYIEKFPFPFYILLRDINNMPLIMGEALRQWFELITNFER